MKRILTRTCWFSCALLVLAFSSQESTATEYWVFGRVLDGATGSPQTNVNVQFFFDTLGSAPDADPILLNTNTDTAGNFAFGNISDELSGEVSLAELPPGYVAPMKATIRLSALTPTNQVIFRAGPAAALSGSIVITNGTAAFTNFTVEVNATEANAATNGSFLIPELPASQQTARLIYQVGYYFDERVISLPAMTAGQTNSLQILWHQPMHNLSASGTLLDATGNALAGTRIRFLGVTTGVFVGTMTDANGSYAVYDLPDDTYMARAFVGRWGVEQRVLLPEDSILCIGNGGGSSLGDAICDSWRQWYFGSGTTTDNFSCAWCDADGDGVSNLLEYQRGTNPNDPNSVKVTLYADSAVGSNSYDGLRPSVMGGHGPKKNIQSAIAAAISGDSINIASGQYTETTLDPQAKTVTLNPVGTVTIP